MVISEFPSARRRPGLQVYFTCVVTGLSMATMLSAAPTCVTTAFATWGGGGQRIAIIEQSERKIKCMHICYYG